MNLLKAGAVWDDIHITAHELAIEGLLKLGILKGDKEAILKARTSVAFMPHGLGHYLGMDTHDTGGHANYADKDTMFRYLRVRGPVPAGSVITVEPGVCFLLTPLSIPASFLCFPPFHYWAFILIISKIYFCRFIIEPYLADPVHSQFINTDVLERYWLVGGVRIEDDVLVLDGGYENLTTAIKDPDELERIIIKGL